MCLPLNLPAPSCDSISVSPTTGTTPFNSVVSCNTTSATTVSIACGNGQVINSANGTCNYTTAGTFAPRCTVNGNISGASCVGSVTANPAVSNSFDLSIKKYVNNVDAQSSASAVNVGTSTGFTYTIQVRND